MNTTRRRFLKSSTLTLALVAASTTGLGLITPAFATRWNRKAFQGRNARNIMSGLGFDQAAKSGKIQIIAPHLTESGGRVPMKISSSIPGTESITLVVDKNYNPLTYQTEIPKDGVAFVATHIKMAQSSDVHVLVRANGKNYKHSKFVKVVIGGC